jgi:choline dehydrogenase-like flavoprotein
MLGRWQPWHPGHRALFERLLERTGQVVIQIRDVQGWQGSNPFGLEEVKQRIRHDLDPLYQGQYEIQIVPNIVHIGWGRGVGADGFGAQFKESLTHPGQWTVGFGGFGEILPNPENRFVLSDKKDKWGLPVLEFSAEFGQNELQMREDMMNEAATMLEAAGFKNINAYNKQDTHIGLGIHEMGTARMGTSVKNSIVNKHNQVHEVKNVFMTDGAVMASASCVNPSLTYMAMTARAADFAVSELKKRNL